MATRAQRSSLIDQLAKGVSEADVMALTRAYMVYRKLSPPKRPIYLEKFTPAQRNLITQTHSAEDAFVQNRRLFQELTGNTDQPEMGYTLAIVHILREMDPTIYQNSKKTPQSPSTRAAS